jgi:vacuolar-type H+-ATPase subunit E/Vma4
MRVLEQEIAVRRRAERFDRENAEEVRRRLDQGFTQIARLTEAQRAAIDSAARLRAAEAALLETQERIVETRGQINRLDDERRLLLTQERRRVAAEVAATHFRVREAAAKLSYVGGLGQVQLEARELPYVLNVVRGARGGEILRDVPLDMPVLPGDVVELHIDLLRE